MATIELKDQQWQEFVKQDYAVVDCYGENCAACVMLAPVFDAVADERSGIAFGRVNISLYPDIADRFGIDAMPTVLFFRRGEAVHRALGSMEHEELLEQLSVLLYQ